MIAIQWLKEYTVDWQHLVCLLHALRELGGENSRSETVTFIRRNALLALTAEDNTSYPTQTEPRWHTDIAYARKIGGLLDLVSFHRRDAWSLTRDGDRTIERLVALGREAQIDGGQCFLWTIHLRRVFDPDYAPSATDAARPAIVHRTNWRAHYEGIAAMIIGSGKADGLCRRLSEDLGTVVALDPVSLGSALKTFCMHKHVP